MRIPTLAVVCFSVLPLAGLYAESEYPQKRGRVIAAQVSGKVEATEVGGGAPRLLKSRDVLGENNAVSVGVDSSATLVFSNGATINMGRDSKLVISEFLQNPFGTPFSMPIEEAESTVSTTKLNLKAGEVVAKVKKLNTEEGSSLTVTTPVGAAGIRGTTFAISYVPNSDGNGRGRYTLSVTEGAVSFTDMNGNVTLVTAGRELAISFTSRTDPETGETSVIEILGSEMRDIAPDRLEAINQAAENGEVIADTIIFDPGMDPLLDTPQIVDGLQSTAVTVINPPEPVTEVNPLSNIDAD